MSSPIVVRYVDCDGLTHQVRFHREFDACRFEDSLACEGLSHWRVS
jgi:hypothetical protein